MTRWSLMSLILALCTACPETWREGGTIDRAMAKDIQDGLRSRRRPPACQMSDKEWAERCDFAEGTLPSTRCPPSCRD
ncbi:hypothetical protein CYFUS_000695 [Cystobacter fuscus]|uniref:Uncharacterized protein n=1 Tax=Cystobacter fuscus TaxID=43 RepID=A0A250IVJ5_9BACT|nr:hypothetical protein CYFUS_000695 [Cystobacter fuscus]